MALQVNDATAFIDRTTGLVASNSDYACCFWCQLPGAISGSEYVTAWFVSDSPDYVGMFGYDSAPSHIRMSLDVDSAFGGAVTTERVLGATQRAHLAYRRSGNNHFFYFNGVLVGSVSHNITGLTFNYMAIGNDGFSAFPGPMIIWDFKEWNDDKSIGVIQAEMVSVGAVASPTNLVTYTPLDTNLNDVSGNGNHWSGAGNFEFVDQPALPSNMTAGAAVPLSITLAEQTIERAVDESEIGLPLWYTYTNSTARDQVISVGHWGDLTAGGYAPDAAMYFTEDLNNSQVVDSFSEGSFYFPVPAGQQVWIEFRSNPIPTTIAPSTLHLKTLRGPEGPAQVGDIFIRSASFSGGPDIEEVGLTGLPGGFVRPTESEIVGYIPQFITGESGDILPTSGRMLFADEAGTRDGFPFPLGAGFGYWFYLFDGDFNVLTRVSMVSDNLPPLNRTHLPTEKFYLLGRILGGQVQYATVDADGNKSAVTTIASGAGGATALAANNAETYLYLAVGGAIKRWNLNTLTFDSNLAAAVAGYVVTDLLVLEDDTILACYFKSSVTRDVFVRHYNASGTLLDTYTFTLSATMTSVHPRLGYSSVAGTFWIFNHLTTAYSDIRRIRVSDGVALITSITPDVNQSGIAQADPPIPYTSDSCPIVELRTSQEGMGGIIGPYVWWHRRRLIPDASPTVGT